MKTRISFIGSGSPGGKGAGLVRIQSFLEDQYPEGQFANIALGLPETNIVLSDTFELFITDNKLVLESFNDASDEQVSIAFNKASFPPLLLGEIRKISHNSKGPLAIRSSSLTEDSLDRPFAGIFATKMIPNNSPDPDIRFTQLIDAVKFVYASTWFRSARDSFKSAGIDLTNERMSVIIQLVHGKMHDHYYYPSFSGVGRSFNYYPFAGCSRESGLVELAAGLGKTIVDGGRKWIFCPEKPEAPPPASMKDLLDSGQNRLWMINLSPPEKESPFDETEFMTEHRIKSLEDHGEIEHLCSTYSAESDRLEMGYKKNGFKLLDFSPILKGNSIDFNDCIKQILTGLKERTGSDIEIEFAVNLKKGSPFSAELALLQIRPMKLNKSDGVPDVEDYSPSSMIVFSDSAIGNTVINNIEDFIFIHPEDFSAENTALMPAEMEELNRRLVNSNKHYILCGFGRWGSSDPALGIPVKWSQISGARVLIESTLPEMNPELSQGSHFFHNILNTGTVYMSVDNQDTSTKSFIDYDYLGNQVIISKGKFFTHIALKKGIGAIVNGKTNKGAILKMESDELKDDSLLHQLNERAKELECLYLVKEIVHEAENIENTFSKLVNIIPSGWQFPALCSARIFYENKVFTSDNFTESKWFQSSELCIRGHRVGAVEVHYSTETMVITTPFLPEEQQLLNTIAERIENFLFQKDLLSTVSQWEKAKKDFESKKKPDWMVILELVERMDSNLFNKLSRRMLNRLCLLGVEDAQNVLGCLGIKKSCDNIPVEQDVNIPSLKIKFELYNKFHQNIFKLASENLSADEIAVLLNRWIREDKTGFLVSVLENTNSPVSEIAAAISRYHHLNLPDNDISAYSRSNINALFIQRIFTEQMEFVRSSREHIDINDFYPVLQHSIYPNDSHGKLGGKSAGLFIAWQFLKEAGIKVSIPRTWYVSSDYMLKFIYYNNLEEVHEQKYKSIEEIRADYTNLIQVFKNSNFPIDLINSLSLAVEDFGRKPIIIRSSSLLEDRFGAAFSGKYKSLFLANQGTKEERLTSVLDAIAEIYASVFGPDPIEYRKEHNLLEFHEEMAIIIQEVVGQQAGDYFFPAFAGVGFGYNEYRWSPKIKKEDGLLRIVPGLGTRAVDRLSNDYPLLICPANPGLKVNPMPSEALKYSPSMMDVINIKENTFETVEIDKLIKNNPEQYPDIEMLYSIYEDDIFKIKNRYQIDAEKDEFVFTLEPLIANTPVIPKLKRILDELNERLDNIVDIEFAYSNNRLYLLQCRPQAGYRDSAPPPIPMDIEDNQLLFTAKKFITNGIVDNIDYTVYVDPEAYNSLSSLQDLERVGKAVGKLNSALPKRRFILMGPGRWGSRGDIKMGVRVNYSDINNTAMLIEIARKKGDYIPEVSFGTHFFQDLVEASIKYLPLYPDNENEMFKEAELTRSKNILGNIYPEFSDLSNVVYVTDIREEYDGKVLKILMNEDINQAIAFFSEPTSRTTSLDVYSQTSFVQEDYWSWRYSMAENIAANLNPEKFGVKAIYIIGSTKNATAGPMSDIDLLILIEEDMKKKELLSTWLDGWSRCLGRLNFLRTGYKTEKLLDVHYITDQDIKKKTSMALKINAVTDAARKLTIGKSGD